MISIHALREEGDLLSYFDLLYHLISIHALREEGDGMVLKIMAKQTFYFYPRPPRGGRRWSKRILFPGMLISIHALREEGDLSLLIRLFIP